jgi:hypothetical protein
MSDLTDHRTEHIGLMFTGSGHRGTLGLRPTWRRRANPLWLVTVTTF